jgi:hypothetical protein
MLFSKQNFGSFIVKLGMNSTKASFSPITIVKVNIVGHRGC